MPRVPSGLKSQPKRAPQFVEPMECLSVSTLPESPQWRYEIKLDGYRAIAIKTGKTVSLLSRRAKSFNRQYPLLVQALAGLPDDTVVDGEVVALDEEGKPDFNLLQQFRSEASRIHYFIFDLLILESRDLTTLPLEERREFLKGALELCSSRIRISEQFDTSARHILAAVREQHLEGVIGKRRDGRYEAGKRTGSWIKYRVSKGQEFVVGGYLPGPYGFDSLVVGYYRGDELTYVARVRNGFVPASRREVFARIGGLVSNRMPFSNLPDERSGRWSEGLTSEKMKRCVWLRPEVVVEIEFLEWTGGDRLRHSKFVRLRPDKDPIRVVKEQVREP